MKRNIGQGLEEPHGGSFVPLELGCTILLAHGWVLIYFPVSLHLFSSLGALWTLSFWVFIETSLHKHYWSMNNHVHKEWCSNGTQLSGEVQKDLEFLPKANSPGLALGRERRRWRGENKDRDFAFWVLLLRPKVLQHYNKRPTASPLLLWSCSELLQERRTKGKYCNKRHAYSVHIRNNESNGS
jgi:hypothetical protein